MQQWAVVKDPITLKWDLWIPKHFVMGTETAAEAETFPLSSDREWRWLEASNINVLCYRVEVNPEPEDIVRVTWATMLSLFFPPGVHRGRIHKPAGQEEV
jgi:hypothetical protein